MSGFVFGLMLTSCILICDLLAGVTSRCGFRGFCLLCVLGLLCRFDCVCGDWCGLVCCFKLVNLFSRVLGVCCWCDI